MSPATNFACPIASPPSSLLIAGDANRNTARAAEKHYAKFVPKDRTRRANSILFSKKPKKKVVEETELEKSR
jgi:hypothetical protein